MLATDLPFLTADVLDRLRAALSGRLEAAVLVDDLGRPQWLCSAWPREALVGRLPQLAIRRDGRCGRREAADRCST